MTDEPAADFIAQAQEAIFAKLAAHPDEGVRAINALIGTLPADDPGVLKVARALERKARAT